MGFGFQTIKNVQNPNKIVRFLDIRQKPNCLEMVQELNIQEPNVFGFQRLTVYKINKLVKI